MKSIISTFHRDPPSSSSSRDWLGNCILAARVICASADYVPFPYIKTVFGTALAFLETVERIKQNRDDLEELCLSTLQIVSILKEELSFHGDTAGIRFRGLCEEPIGTVSGDA
ncbi:hypothetical protein B0H16DRAFT_520140 [Mycena metata]|uniref:Uncharacterized protein n=1 Tax=Mycena metata TaxID=1033252 RepID=A0AAD7H8Q3_9AGAR|nr:hypothetical protein B0H16DRAFT_520140 [Mycena metata]